MWVILTTFEVQCLFVKLVEMSDCFYGYCFMLGQLIQVCMYDNYMYSWYIAGSSSSASWAASSDGSGDLAVTVKQTDIDGQERYTLWDKFPFSLNSDVFV